MLRCPRTPLIARPALPASEGERRKRVRHDVTRCLRADGARAECGTSTVCFYGNNAVDFESAGSIVDGGQQAVCGHADEIHIFIRVMVDGDWVESGQPLAPLWTRSATARGGCPLNRSVDT